MVIYQIQYLITIVYCRDLKEILAKLLTRVKRVNLDHLGCEVRPELLVSMEHLEQRETKEKEELESLVFRDSKEIPDCQENRV